MGTLTRSELSYLISNIGRKPNLLEREIVGAEWSEHCSYKSSKIYLRKFPTRGKNVVVGPGYDAGVLNVGGGYVITVHIESHNHPSAVEPFGGAATGVGGVIRDIISMGTRPIALFDALRFGPIKLLEDGSGNNNKNNSKKETISKSKWLMKNVVKGIAEYGNCIGIPTVGGEIEFDPSFVDYCLVDVAAIGHGKKRNLLSNHADIDDLIILAGGKTGRDGIHGASFASKKLEENRSAVQIPDPFLEKLLIEATMEVVEKKLINAIKDLGGGGLACCLSETSDNLGRGFEIELSKIHKKYPDMSAHELMISESQERMLYIINPDKLNQFNRIFEKFSIEYSVIGSVKSHKNLVIKNNNRILASISSKIVANAPLLNRRIKQPEYIKDVESISIDLPEIVDYNHLFIEMMANPNIFSKKWIYEQYDHEIGLRTFQRPGFNDSPILKLDNGKYISLKLDGNSKICYINPFQGTLNVLSEAVRNITCSGAKPIGLIDHLQFGDPGNPEIFWTFKETIDAIIKFSKYNNIPIVGGKVSFYNETENGAIKPSPVIGCIGLIDKESDILTNGLTSKSTIYVIGETTNDMGGSEYYSHIYGINGGKVPILDLKKDKLHTGIIHKLAKANLIDSISDCSKGGISSALVKMTLNSQKKIGVSIDIEKIINSCGRIDNILFSETPSRYIIGTENANELENKLKKEKIQFAKIGRSTDEKILFNYKNRPIIDLDLKTIEEKYYSLGDIFDK